MTRIPRILLAASLLVSAVACGNKVDIEKVPIGAHVDVTRQDGGVISGTLASRDDDRVRVDVGRTMRSIPRDQIAVVQVVDYKAAASERPSLPSKARFREYTVPAGTVLVARLDSSLGSDTSRVDDPVEATLSQPIVEDGIEVLPAGSLLKGVVTVATKSGNVKGRASLAMRFQSISPEGREGTYPLSAGAGHTAAPTKGEDAKKIGIPAAGGAIIGALIGGGKGAGIGALVGGGAGAAVVLTTSGPEVRYARGTQLSLRTDQDIDVHLPIRR